MQCVRIEFYKLLDSRLKASLTGKPIKILFKFKATNPRSVLCKVPFEKIIIWFWVNLQNGITVKTQNTQRAKYSPVRDGLLILFAFRGCLKEPTMENRTFTLSCLSCRARASGISFMNNLKKTLYSSCKT